MVKLPEIQEEFLKVFVDGEKVFIKNRDASSFWVCLGASKILVEVTNFIYTLEELKKREKDQVVATIGVGGQTTSYHSQSGPKVFLVDNDVRGEADLTRAAMWTRIMLLEDNYNQNNPHPSYTRQQEILEDVKNNGSKKKPRGFVKLYNALADYAIYFFSIVGLLIMAGSVITMGEAAIIIGMILLFIGIFGTGAMDNPLGLFCGVPVIGAFPFIPIIVPAYFIKEHLRKNAGERKNWPTRNDGLIYYGNMGYAVEEIDAIKDGILGPDGLGELFVSKINDKKILRVVSSIAKDEKLADYTLGFSYSDWEILSRPKYNTPRDALADKKFKESIRNGSMFNTSKLSKSLNNGNKISQNKNKLRGKLKKTARKVTGKITSVEEKLGEDLVDGVHINDDDYNF